MRVARTDSDGVLRNHEDRIGSLERNGVDPAVWVVVGSGSPAPPFQNGFTNVGGDQVPMRYRFLRPIDAELDPNVYTPNAIELQGAVTGGTLGAVIFTLLEPRYLPDGTPDFAPVTRDFALHLAACDSAGGFVPFTVQTNGDVVFGFV